MGKSMDHQFGRFLRQQRGKTSYGEFACRLGIAASTLYRLEHAKQSVTLGKMEDILERLERTVDEVFKKRR